jgi:hypothetical protein
MRRVAELDVRQRHLAVALDEYPVRPVHHDVGDAVILEQRLQRAEPKHVVDQLTRELALLARVELKAPLGGDLRQDALHLQHQPVGRHAGEGCGIELRQARDPELRGRCHVVRRSVGRRFVRRDRFLYRCHRLRQAASSAEAGGHDVHDFRPRSRRSRPVPLTADVLPSGVLSSSRTNATSRANSSMPVRKRPRTATAGSPMLVA